MYRNVPGIYWHTFFSFKDLFLVICMYVLLSVCGGVHMVCKCLWSPEEGVRFPDSRVPGSCEPPDVDAKNQTQVLCKNSACS